MYSRVEIRNLIRYNTCLVDIRVNGTEVTLRMLEVIESNNNLTSRWSKSRFQNDSGYVIECIPLSIIKSKSVSKIRTNNQIAIDINCWGSRC